MDIAKWFIGHVERPMLMLLRGWGGRISYERFFSERLNCSIDENLELQRKLLYDLISDAVRNVPYYREIARRENIAPTPETIEEDLKSFPILTKDIIRKESASLKSETPGTNIFANTSGGSTGVPVKFLQDKEYRLKTPVLIMDGFTGYRFGDKLVQLWGSERDILQSGTSHKNRLMNAIYYRKRMLNTFRMTDADMLDFVNKINSFKPAIMLAYVQSAYELARFIERENLVVHKMKGIITSAGTLYDDFREKIEAVFGCPAFNRYGSREVGIMAMECGRHEGLHLNLFGQYMEILDDAGKPVQPGQTGNVVVTSLTNYTMPLIRFEIGDMAVPSGHVCSCGMGLPLIESVRGRTVNVFKTKSGTLVDGEYFTHLFYEYDFVRQFQVVQEALDRIVVKYALASKALSDAIDFSIVESSMREKIFLVMGNDCKVEFKRLEEIPPTASGKFVYTVSNI